MKKYIVGHYFDCEGFSVEEFDTLDEALSEYNWNKERGYDVQLFLAEVIK